MNLLVDTNIFIDYFKQDHSLEKIFFSEIIKIYYSILTKKELLSYRGLSSKEKRTILGFLSNFRVIPIDPQIAETTSFFLEKYKKKGLLVPDAIIAATAWVKNMPLLTRNIKHFRFIKEIDVNTAPIKETEELVRKK